MAIFLVANVHTYIYLRSHDGITPAKLRNYSQSQMVATKEVWLSLTLVLCLPDAWEKTEPKQSTQLRYIPCI